MRVLPLGIFVGVLIVLLAGCTQQIQQPTQPQQPQPQEQQPIAQQEKPMEKPAGGIDKDVGELLAKSSKVKSLGYLYKGPETGENFYQFYSKGDKVAYYPGTTKTFDRPESYNAVYFDTKQKTAEAWCTDRACRTKGKKADFDFKEAYIETPFDYINSITYGTKLGEGQIEQRSTWKVNTSNGVMWIDGYYGVPLKVEQGSSTYVFSTVNFNGITDEQVVPPAS